MEENLKIGITEDYVPFEIAILLEEKGFNEPLFTYYITDENKKEWSFRTEGFNNKKVTNYHRDYNHCHDKYWYLAPTIPIVVKWLRIEYNIHVEPHIVKTKYSYGYMPNYIDLKELKQHFPFDEFDFSNADQYVCLTPDKAYEVTIKYILEKVI